MSIKRNVWFMGVLLLCALTRVALAQPLSNGGAFFDVKVFNERFDDLRARLASTKAHLPSLNRYVEQLEELQRRAKYCVEQSQDQVKSITELLKDTQTNHVSSLQQSDYSYLKEKRSFYVKQLSSCRLFVYRSQEVLVTYKDEIKKLTARKILKRSTPLWKVHEDGMLASLAKFDIKKAYVLTGIGQIELSEYILGAVLLAIVGLISVYLRSLCRRWLSSERDVHTSITSLMTVLASAIIPVSMLLTLSLFSSVVFEGIAPNPALELLSYGLLAACIFIFVSACLFHPKVGIDGLLHLKEPLGRVFHKRIFILTSWLLVGYGIAILFREQTLSFEIVDISRACFVIISSGLALWVVWPIERIPYLQKTLPLLGSLIKWVLCTVLVTIIFMEIVGFHRLAVFFLNGLLLSAGVVGVGTGMWYLVDILYHVFDDSRYMPAKKLRQWVGLKYYKKVSELSFIRLVAYVLILFVAIIALMKIWGFSENAVDNMVDGFTEGFIIFDLKLVPVRFLAALIAFSGVFLIGRLIATAFARKQSATMEDDVQVAVSSIITYIAFASALLLALLVIGINFTGLAIIAGALSVGIGLGLQNIVNNFVSGIILLLEKPIRPGDRVIVDGTEGFVKKIRIRSTQIATLYKSDVIVPNADFITHQVTNYMFRDRYWRVACQVGVAYGSDIEKVKEVLLEVAAQHPDVIQEAPNEPLVIFSQFGDSSLVFDLWCVIREVNKKFIVTSELNFAIDKSFKAHSITIAFPQRDIHIKADSKANKALESEKEG